MMGERESVTAKIERIENPAEELPPSIRAEGRSWTN